MKNKPEIQEKAICREYFCVVFVLNCQSDRDEYKHRQQQNGLNGYLQRGDRLYFLTETSAAESSSYSF